MEAFKTQCTASLMPLLAAIAFLFGGMANAQTPPYKLGRTPTREEVHAWDIGIGPDGKELPSGSGTAKEGAKLFAQKCAACHGANGEGTKLAPRLIGGKGSLTSAHPVKTVGSYWPFATSIWDYINRAMPLNQEESLSPDEVYSLTAFLLFRNDIINETDIIDAKSLPKVQMPNRNGFLPARLEDIPRQHCPLGTCP